MLQHIAHTSTSTYSRHCTPGQHAVSCVLCNMISILCFTSNILLQGSFSNRTLYKVLKAKPAQHITVLRGVTWGSRVRCVQPTVHVSGCRPTAWLCMTADHPAWPPLEEQIGVLFGGECSLFGCLDIYPGWGHCGHWTLARGCGQSLSRSELWFWWPAQIILSWDSPMDLLWLVLLCVKSLSQANHYDGH